MVCGIGLGVQGSWQNGKGSCVRDFIYRVEMRREIRLDFLPFTYYQHNETVDPGLPARQYTDAGGLLVEFNNTHIFRVERVRGRNSFFLI